jgi:hypothetical protein
MTREEFKTEARNFGYSDEETKELLSLHDDLDTPYEEIPLLKKIVD